MPTAKRRTSKIAQLSKSVRDQLNLMLQDGVPYRKILKNLGEEAKGLIERNISDWFQGGYQDWLKEQQWREDTRARHESATDLIDKLDLGKMNQAALYVAALQMFEALRNLGTTGLNDKLGGDCAAYARLINALSRASKETLALQKHSELRAKAEAQASAAVLGVEEREVEVNKRNRSAILGALDQAMGFDKPVRFIEDLEAEAEQAERTAEASSGTLSATLSKPLSATSSATLSVTSSEPSSEPLSKTLSSQDPRLAPEKTEPSLPASPIPDLRPPSSDLRPPTSGPGEPANSALTGGNGVKSRVAAEEETDPRICGACGRLPPALAPDIPRPWDMCGTCRAAEEAAEKLKAETLKC